MFIGLSTYYDLFTSMSSFEHFRFSGKFPAQLYFVHEYIVDLLVLHIVSNRNYSVTCIIIITENSKKHLVLQSFSLSKNIEKLLTFPKTSDNLECIHGLKFVSMCFIIVGHRFMFTLGSPMLNTHFIEYVSKFMLCIHFRCFQYCYKLKLCMCSV